MPQDQNKRQRLYDALKSSGYQLPDYEKFDAGLNDPERRKRLYESLQQDRFQLPEFSVFDSQLGRQVQMGQPQQRQPCLLDRANQSFMPPAQTMAKGLGQITSPQYPTSALAGVGNLAAGAAQMAGWPIAVGTEAIKSLPSGGLHPGVDLAKGVIGAAESGLGAVGDFFGGHARNATLYLTSRLFGKEAAEELAQPAEQLGSLTGQLAVTGGIAKGVKTTVPKVQGVAGVRQARTAAKIGELVGAGQNLAEARRAGQFMVEEKIPVSKVSGKPGRFGIEAASEGAEKSRKKVQELNQALNEKIIDPATEAGITADARPILDAAIDLYKLTQEEFLPNRTILRRMENELKTLAETIDQNGGKLTPRQIQDYKVKNNALLKEIYEKKSRGSLTEKQEAREAILLDANSKLRKMLEDLHSDVGRINWTEGAGLDVAKALDAFIEKKLGRDPSMARGSGLTPAAAGRRYGQVLFGLTELSTYAPFRVAYNKLLNRVYGEVAGTGKEFIKPGQVQPFSPPPADATRIGNIIPTSARASIIRQLGGADKKTRLGKLGTISDMDLIILAREAGLYGNAPPSEAPVSRGGSMDVRGPANQEQIRKFK